MSELTLPEAETFDAVRHRLTPQELKRAYASMALIRAFEERVLQLFAEGVVRGTTHTCVGQEAVAVGVAQMLEDGDGIVSNHRNHGHYLARFDDSVGLLHEILGLKSGVSSGIGGSQHIHREGFYSNGVLGGTAPLALGLALARKFKKTNSIAVQFIGDGAFGEGVVYEALNLAALWRAPLLIVVENNYYAQSTPSTLQLAGSFAGRAAAFGISATEVTTNDVRIVRALATEQIAAVRSECRPAMLIVNTYRLKPHSKGDEMRDPTEIERWRSRDPLSIDYGLPNASELLQAALGRIAEESEDALKALRGGACAA